MTIMIILNYKVKLTKWWWLVLIFSLNTDFYITQINNLLDVIQYNLQDEQKRVKSEVTL